MVTFFQIQSHFIQHKNINQISLANQTYLPYVGIIWKFILTIFKFTTDDVDCQCAFNRILTTDTHQQTETRNKNKKQTETNSPKPTILQQQQKETSQGTETHNKKVKPDNFQT